MNMMINMKVAIIAIAKNENQYVNEWIDYHLHIGFDNIIICDNDDELILKDVVTDERVIIEDYTKVVGVQQLAYRQTFVKYRTEYDWFLFIDIDEFLILENYSNVKDFLSSYDDSVQCINICWKHFNDNDELDVIDGNYNVFDRFKTQVKTKWDGIVKAFIKTNIPEPAWERITQHSIFYYRIKSVDVLGHRHYGKYMRIPIYKKAWLNHYVTKTIGEYVRQKYFRGGANHNNIKYRNLNNFFRYNTRTKEKEEYGKKLINELKQKI